jgi:hypothetical protein
MSDKTPQPVDKPHPAPTANPRVPNERAAEPPAPRPQPHPDPTRYGDWEKNGQCIDF